MAKIRVGMLRCDLHAIYYAALMQKHDVALLRDPDIGQGGYFYFYTYYGDPMRMTAPRVPGFDIVKIWDDNRARAEKMSRLFLGKPKVCARHEEVSDGVDLVFIADCGGDGSDHLKLAAPGLRKGVPTFVDKPFARRTADAQEIVRLAMRHRAPVMSLSILRAVPDAAQFAMRLDELGGVMFGVIEGGGGNPAGQIHGISLAQNIFGNGVQTVECMGGTEYPYHALLSYGNRKDRPQRGVVINLYGGGGPHCAFYASAYGPLGAIHSPPIGDFQFPWGAAAILRKVKRMVQTRKPQAPYSEMVENVAVLNALWQAHRTHRPAAVR